MRPLRAGLALALSILPVGMTSVSYSAATRTGTGLEAEVTKIDSRVRDFPEFIPGAREVKKYAVPNSRYCLVHIRQEHKNPVTNKWSPGGIAVQDDIYTILSYLLEKKLISRRVFAEGVYDGSYRAINEEFKRPRSPRKDPVSLSDLVNETVDELNSPRCHLDMTYAKNRLGVEGKLFIRPASWTESDKMTVRAINKGNKSKYDASNYEREVVALQSTTADQRDMVTAIIFGAAHDFRAAVEEQNRGIHPGCNYTYSLIVITPRSLSSEFDK